MSDNPEISASVNLDLAKYQRSIRQGISSADDFDDALNSLIDEANAAEKALNDLSGDIKLDIDADFSSLLAADRTLQSLDTTISPLVDISVVNEQEALRLLDQFNGTLTANLNINDSELRDAQQLLDRLDSAAPSVPVDVDDAEIDTTKRKVEDLDSETIDTKVNVDDSELDGIKTQLEALRNLAIIDLVMNLPASIPSPEDIPLLGAIIEADTAARNMVASLGEAGKQNAGTYEAGATAVFTAGVGADRGEAFAAYAETVRLTKNDTGDLTKTSEDFTAVTVQGWATAKASGEDYNGVIRAADTLVSTGLAPSYEAAFDLINTGFAEGLNKGGQFLDTITEFGTAFADLDVDGEGFLSFLKQGLDAGAKDTAQLGEMVIELNAKMQTAFSGSGAEFDAFRALGLRDELKAAQAGEITGAEFASALFTALEANAGKKNIAELMTATLGSKSEELTLPVIVQLDPTQIQAELSNVEGATLEVQALVMGDLGTSWESLKRTVENELATSVSSAFDIPGKIKQFEAGVKTVSDQLAAGATLPEAIEVAFQLPGFAEGVDTLASGMGNLGISFMQLVASVLDALGQGGAAGTVRGTIAQAAEAQLAFDLKLANDGTDFSNAVKAAVDRGVAEADVQAAIATAGGELLATGDMTGAQTFLTALEDMATIELSPDMTAFLTGEGIDPTNLDAVKTKLQEVTTTQIGGGLTGLLNLEQFDSIHKEASGILGEMDFATPAQTALAPFKQEFTAAEEAATKNFENMRQAAELHLPGIAETAASTFTPMQTQITGTDEAFTNMTTGMATDSSTLASTLATLSGNIDAFAANADVQFAETTVGALDSADLKMLAFGVTVTNTMLQANADVQGLIDKLLSIGGLDIALPAVGGGPVSAPTGFVAGPAPMSGGQQIIPGQSVGGSVEAGTLAKVHAEELLYAGDTDVSVLNRQTSSVIDNALSALVGGGGAGGNTTNYYVTNNVVVNTSGAAATTAAMDSKAIRGY